MKRVNGKVVQKYVGYLGKSLNSKNEIEPEEILKYISRLLKKGISQEEMDEILKKIGIEYDAWPITKIIIENDLKLKKVFIRPEYCPVSRAYLYSVYGSEFPVYKLNIPPDLPVYLQACMAVRTSFMRVCE